MCTFGALIGAPNTLTVLQWDRRWRSGLLCSSAGGLPGTPLRKLNQSLILPIACVYSSHAPLGGLKALRTYTIYNNLLNTTGDYNVISLSIVAGFNIILNIKQKGGKEVKMQLCLISNVFTKQHNQHF